MTADEQIRVAAEAEPEQQPHRPNIALSREELAEVRARGPVSPQEEAAVVATLRWQRWTAEVMQRNRAALSALLWACHEWKGQPAEERDNRIGAQLLRGLRAWSVPEGVRVPASAADRRLMVETWGTAAWFRLMDEMSREAA